MVATTVITVTVMVKLKIDRCDTRSNIGGTSQSSDHYTDPQGARSRAWIGDLLAKIAVVTVLRM